MTVSTFLVCILFPGPHENVSTICLEASSVLAPDMLIKLLFSGIRFCTFFTVLPPFFALKFLDTRMVVQQMPMKRPSRSIIPITIPFRTDKSFVLTVPPGPVPGPCPCPGPGQCERAIRPLFPVDFVQPIPNNPEN